MDTEKRWSETSFTVVFDYITEKNSIHSRSLLFRFDTVKSAQLILVQLLGNEMIAEFLSRELLSPLLTIFSTQIPQCW